jgi:hypothetical protein
VFSFYANKTITTGEGGMLVTRDAGIAKRASVMRLHGMNRDAFDRFTAKVPSWYYEVVAPGFKYNLTDIAAALGIHQLRGRTPSSSGAKQIAALVRRRLAGLPLVTAAQRARRPARRTPGTCTCCAWPMTPAWSATASSKRLFDAGIGCSVHYIPLHLHPYWRDRYDLKPEMFPHSQHAYERMVSLPLYTRMSDADVRARAADAPCARCWPEAGGQAVGRSGGRGARLCCCCRPCCWQRPADQTRFARAGVLPPGACRPRTGGLSHPQVPHHGGQRARACRSRWVPTRASRALAAWLRRTRVDELPQFIDVLQGHMSLVGPRPEVPRYVALYPPELRDRALAVRPGITDPASLAYIDENALLARAADPEREYVEVILPAKLRCAVEYAETATLWTDLRVLAHTLRRLATGGLSPPPTIARLPLPWAAATTLSTPAALTLWHRLDLWLARLRPHREPLSLLVDGLVIALCWNITYLFRLGFERWISARPGYDIWVMLGVIACYLLAFTLLRVPQSMWRFAALARSSG